MTKTNQSSLNLLPFEHFFREYPEVRRELLAHGISFISLDVGAGEPAWPALRMPSGYVIGIARDDEGNGPGALHIFIPRI